MDDYEVQLTSKKKEAPQPEGQLIVDVFQDEDHIYIQSMVAGVKGDNLDISITNDMVTIKGRREPPVRIRPDNYFYQELYWGPFSRSIILPADIDSDSAKASINNGFLTIKLPKLERTRTKRIRIE